MTGRLRDRLVANWRTKLWLGTALSVAFGATYLAAQHVPLREPHLLTQGPIDRFVPFDPRWAWPYASFEPLMATAWLASTREQLARYAVGFLVVTLAGLACFVCFPTTISRPDAADAGGLYRLLIALDRPTNCLPSQHVALAVYATLFAGAVTRSRGLLVALAAWALVIAYATLAIKQHYFVDLPAGAALGVAGHWVAWRAWRRERT